MLSLRWDHDQELQSSLRTSLLDPLYSLSWRTMTRWMKWHIMQITWYDSICYDTVTWRSGHLKVCQSCDSARVTRVLWYLTLDARLSQSKHDMWSPSQQDKYCLFAWSLKSGDTLCKNRSLQLDGLSTWISLFHRVKLVSKSRETSEYIQVRTCKFKEKWYTSCSCSCSSSMPCPCAPLILRTASGSYTWYHTS